MIKGLKEIEAVMPGIKKKLLENGGLRQVIFAACGGSFASSYPARYLMNQEGSIRVQGFNSSEFLNATPKNVNENTLFIGTSTKATEETVEAIRKARSMGAVTLALTGYEDSLTARAADASLIYFHKDEWYEDPSLIHCNSQGTALKTAFWLLKEFDGAEGLYQKALGAFEKLPEIYGAAYQKVKPDAVRFAMDYSNDLVWNTLASGSSWEAAYADAFCFFQEMQTVHCVPVHSGEYFHGPFETCDKNLAILLLMGVGRTRPLDERAKRFLDRFGGHHYVMDAQKLGLDELDPEVAEYFNGLILHPISKQFISALADIRMHPMSYRRYMWKFDY